MGKLLVVVGGQYGSEAKGAICAYLGAQEQNLLAVRVGGSNAGHTVVDSAGRAWPFRHVPVAAVRPARKTTRLALAAGSEIDYEVLNTEFLELDAAGVEWDLNIDPEATIVDQNHKNIEAGGAVGQHGSTQKGIGAARAGRLMRKAYQAKHLGLTSVTRRASWRSTADIAHDHLAGGGTVLIEGTQGYGLGSHAGDYPYCTSGDCRAIDFMAQAGISPWDPAVTEVEVWVVYRTFPIRIAGNSGPMLHELHWGQGQLAGIKPEYTTVTKKQRRVGAWDHLLAERSLRANGGTNAHIALTFFDYLEPATTNSDRLVAREEHHIETLESAYFGGQKIELVGTGPATLIDRRTT